MPGPGPAELRRGALATAVLEDVDLRPADDGVVLPGVLSGAPPVLVPWLECRRALAGLAAESPAGRRRLARWLRARRWAADLGAERLVPRLRPVGLPVEHVLHPGLDWVQHRVLGGALDLGLGAVGLDPAAPDRVVVLPPPALAAAGLDVELAWPGARTYLQRVGAVAADLLARDTGRLLRPTGDCDVVTLLGARTLREVVAAAAGGLAGVVVPMRTRGWTDLALVDPAFAPAAAAATPAEDRGFARPLLLTADEVRMVAPGGRPEQGVLQVPGPREAAPLRR